MPRYDAKQYMWFVLSFIQYIVFLALFFETWTYFTSYSIDIHKKYIAHKDGLYNNILFMCHSGSFPVFIYRRDITLNLMLMK